MGDTVLLRSSHNTYLSFQGISIKTLQNADKTCHFQIEKCGHDQIGLRTPQGYYVGMSPNGDVYVSDSFKEAQTFTLLMFSNGKKGFCNTSSKLYVGVDHAGNVRGFNDIQEGILFEEVPVHDAPMPYQMYNVPLSKEQPSSSTSYSPPTTAVYENKLTPAMPVYEPASVPAPAYKTSSAPAPVYKSSSPAPAPRVIYEAAPAPQVVYESAPAPAPVYIQQPAPAPAPAPVYIQQQPTPVFVQQAPPPSSSSQRSGGSAAVPLMGGFIVGNALGRRRRR